MVSRLLLLGLLHPLVAVKSDDTSAPQCDEYDVNEVSPSLQHDMEWSLRVLKTDDNAAVNFSPPVFHPAVTCEYCADWRTYRAGKTKGSWNTAIIGDGTGLVSSDGGRTVKKVNSSAGGRGNPFVTMPDGSLHNTGTAGNMDGFHNTTHSSSPSSSMWNVSEDGTVHAHNDGRAASFTGLPSPLICNSSDCMYGAGTATWSQAARLIAADGRSFFVTCTAAVWLCGHFGVPAELAGIHAWQSEDSWNWTWVGRPASLTSLAGYPDSGMVWTRRGTERARSGAAR